MSVLTSAFNRVDLETGEALFEQGSENRAVYCVSKGLIALRSYQENGTSALLRLAYPGEIIGFRSFLGDGLHQTEARALMPSRVCRVPHRNAKRVIQSNISVLSRLTLRCVEEIDRGHARIILASTTSKKQQLADLLHGLMSRHGEAIGDDMRMRLPLSRKDLADLLGVQPETLSRIIGRLETEGAFEFRGRETIMRIPA